MAINTYRDHGMHNGPIMAAAPCLFAFALKALSEIDREIEQHKTSGNDEYWKGLQRISDEGHTAIAKATGREL